MQKIKHDAAYTNLHPLMDDLEFLYADISEREKKKLSRQQGLLNLPYDDSFSTLLELLKEQDGFDDSEIALEHKEIKPLKLQKYDTKNIIVCYSGGKDSFSVVRHYQRMGYNVFAYHIKGLNRTYHDEWKVAEQAAQELGFTLIMDTVAYSGNHTWIEHPLKNMIMLNMALTYGVRNGIGTKIATGNFQTSFIKDVAFEVCGGDCIEMWKAYEKIIQRIIPKFTLHIPNRNFQTAYNALLKEPEYLKYTISCLTPNRFRNLFRERTMRNYKVDLLPNRCGCCWKCAAEYIWFCDHNVLPYDKDYYIHCMEVLLNTVEQETGYLMHNIEYVWSLYLFYPMKKSKAYKELKNAFVRSRKIKIAY